MPVHTRTNNWPNEQNRKWNLNDHPVNSMNSFQPSSNYLMPFRKELPSKWFKMHQQQQWRHHHCQNGSLAVLISVWEIGKNPMAPKWGNTANDEGVQSHTAARAIATLVVWAGALFWIRGIPALSFPLPFLWYSLPVPLIKQNSTAQWWFNLSKAKVLS